MIHKVTISIFISSSQCKRECFTNFNVKKRMKKEKSTIISKKIVLHRM